MAITQEQFDTLVARLEREAADNPAGYSFRVGAFALLGYFYVLAILASLTLIVGGLIAVAWFNLDSIAGATFLTAKVAIPVVLLIVIVMRSMWVRLDEPEGLELNRREYPDLFAVITEVRRATKAPAVHRVLLSSDLNAAVVQIPRLGMFGWQKNFLLLGLPLLQLLSVEEFKAVMAHEFGHLSGSHGRFGAWIYRVRAAWAQLAEALQQQQHWGRFMFVPFLSWYAPKFAAYSFVKARQQEYEADKLAARTVGAQNVANALVRLDLKSADLDQNYWPTVFAAVKVEPQPSGEPFRGLLIAEHRRFLPQASGQLQQALARETSTADTHPCLRDRLSALAVQASIEAPMQRCAAVALLGDKLGLLVEHFDRQWREGVSELWQQMYNEAVKCRDRLAAFENQDMATMNDGDLFEFAELTEEFGNVDDAMPLYRAVVLRNPDHHAAKFACGRLLLIQDNPTGLIQIDSVMKVFDPAIIPGCEQIIEYLLRNGRDDEIEPYHKRCRQQQETEYQAQLELQQIFPLDSLVAHDMKSKDVAALREQLRKVRGVQRAWLARKELKYSKAPLYIIGVEPEAHRYSEDNAGDFMGNEHFDLAIEANLIFVPLIGENRSCMKLFKKLEGSQIFPYDGA